MHNLKPALFESVLHLTYDAGMFCGTFLSQNSFYTFLIFLRVLENLKCVIWLKKKTLCGLASQFYFLDSTFGRAIPINNLFSYHSEGFGNI